MDVEKQVSEILSKKFPAVRVETYWEDDLLNVRLVLTATQTFHKDDPIFNQHDLLAATVAHNYDCLLRRIIKKGIRN